jgi:hypothetical protein
MDVSLNAQGFRQVISLAREFAIIFMGYKILPEDQPKGTRAVIKVNCNPIPFQCARK